MRLHQNTFSGHPTKGFHECQTGARVGIYDLIELLGKGGMGQVWKAHDTHGDRLVALKLLPPEFRSNEEAIAQVRSAFQTVHDLTHQCLCKMIALGEDSLHGAYLVMDYIPGITLSKYRRGFPDGRLPLDLVVRILRPVAEALDYAHQTVVQSGDRQRRGILHRDVKPQNIMLFLEGETLLRVCLIDLGLAAEIRSAATSCTQAQIDTRGTRPYMSPEQLSGKRSQWDGRTDQYSLAVVAYELMAGHPPFEGDDDALLMQAIKSETPDIIDGVRDSINSALQRALAKDKNSRFSSCEDFVEALESNGTDVRRAERDTDNADDVPGRGLSEQKLIELLPMNQGEQDVQPILQRLAEANFDIRDAVELVVQDVSQATCSTLIAALSHANWHVRRASAFLLGKVALANEGIVSSLVVNLADVDQEVRNATQQALEALYPRWIDTPASLQAVPSLIARLEDSNARQVAESVLIQFGPRAVQAVPSLIDKLNHDKPSVRCTAAVVLGVVGTQAKSAIAPLVGALADQASDVRKEAEVALGKISPTWPSSSNAQHAVLKLIERLAGPNDDARKAAARALIVIRPGAEEHIKALGGVAWCNVSAGRLAAMEVLKAVGFAARWSIPALVANLVDADVQVRQAAQEAINQIRPQWEDNTDLDRAVPRLSQILAQSNATIRLDVIGMLTRLGASAGAAVPNLIALSVDSDEAVRHAAQLALSKIEPNWLQSPSLPPAVVKLAESLSDGSWTVRRNAAQALGCIGPAAEPAIPKLVPVLLTDGDNDVRNAAGAALRQIAPSWPNGQSGAISVLIELLSNGSWGVRRDAAALLGCIGQAAQQAIPHLVSLLTDGDNDVRSAVSAALYRIEPSWPNSESGDRMVPRLVEIVATGNDGATAILCQMGARAAQGISALIELLPHSSWTVRRDAAKVLGSIGLAAEPAVPKLVPILLTDGDNDVRNAVGAALCQIAPNWPNGQSGAVSVLIELLSNGSWSVRRDAAALLGGIGQAAQHAIPHLVSLLTDGDNDVRNAVSAALYRIEPCWPNSESGDRMVPRLVEIMATGNDGATAMLCHMGARGAQAIPALIELLPHSSWTVRRDAAKVLGSIGLEAQSAISALRTRLQDSDNDVRQAAQAALESIKADVRVAGGVDPTERPGLWKKLFG